MAHDEPNEDRTRSFVALAAGTTVSHYRIIKSIGSGGMGVVYLAEDTELDRKVALKFLPAALCEDKDCRDRFKREAQAAAKLDHSNIVTIHDVSEYQGRPFIAMQYVSDVSLKQYMQQNELSLSEIINLAFGICDGLSAAHQAGVIHRDIKPSNILVDDSGRPKIADFGLAHIMGEEKLTRTGSTVGTLQYMSPEQAEGKKLDARSDLFSFGVVLYEMITGRRPFTGEYHEAIIQSILQHTPEPLARYKSDLPDELQHVVDKLLDKDTSTRYQNVSECLADLRLVRRRMDSGKTVAYQTMPGRPTVRRGRMIAGVLVVGALALLLWLSPSARHTLSRLLDSGGGGEAMHLAVLPFTNLEKTPASQAVCDGLMEILTSKLTELERFHGYLWVVSASEVRRLNVVSADQANKAFGANLAVTGSILSLEGDIRMTMNLVDAKTGRQLRSSVIDDSLTSVSSLQDSTFIELAEMLQIELQPEDRQRLTAGGTQGGEAYRIYLEAVGYLAHHEKLENIERAIGLFERALEKDPQYALAYAGLGEACWRKYTIVAEPSWEELAIYNSRRAIELNDQAAPVHVTLGVIYRGKGRYEEAIEQFKEALRLNSNSRIAARELARAFETHNMPAEAESAFQSIIKQWPDHSGSYYDLGLFYVRRGRNADALEQLDSAAKQEPKGYRDWNNLGGLAFMLDRREDAGRMWERSLEIEPNMGAYSNLGALYFSEGRFSDACCMYEQALDLEDRDYRIWYNLALACKQIPGENDKMLNAYQQAAQKAEEQLAINPNDPQVLAHLADCYAALDKRDRALSLVKQTLSLTPDDVDLMARAAGAYEQMGMRDSALVWISRAFDLGYPRSQVESLPEMSGLIDDPRYQQIVSRDSALLE